LKACLEFKLNRLPCILTVIFLIACMIQKLPEKLDLQKLDDDRRAYAVQLQSVSRKVSELVLENHPAYATELQRVMELQNSLLSASEICTDGRRSVNHVMR